MSCGMPCWNCGNPIPESRHNLNAMRRVFCTENCAEQFKQPPPREPQPIHIRHTVGHCPVDGAPILDNGITDDPEEWEHGWT